MDSPLEPCFLYLHDVAVLERTVDVQWALGPI